MILSQNDGQLNENDNVLGVEDIVGGMGNDSLKGNAGPNQIQGYFGNDTIYGAKSNDTLYGDGGNDRICGEVGNDSIYGGIGNDQMAGGSEADAFFRAFSSRRRASVRRLPMNYPILPAAGVVTASRVAFFTDRATASAVMLRSIPRKTNWCRGNIAYQ